jgi:hypothetical protein
MKKGGRLFRGDKLLLGVLFFSILIGCVFALTQHYVTITNGAASYIVKEDQPFTFNFTINNSFADNITWVNVTIDGTFSFKALTNGTSASNNIQGGNINIIFVNTSTLLSWYNASSLALPDTNESFWFNATPSTPGTYTLTINTANSTGSFVNTSTLTVTVMEIHNLMTTAGTRNFSTINEDTPAVFNITLNSTVPITLGNITNITISFPSTFNFTAGSNSAGLYTNATKNLAIGATFTNTSTSLTWKNTTNGLITDVVNGSIAFNLSAQEPGNYIITVTTVNSQDSGIHQQNFTVSVRDITNPTILSYNCTKTTGISEGETSPTCLCTAVDNYDSSPTLSYTSSLSTVNAGTYTVYCTATDDATYNSTASVTYTVDASGGGYNPGGGGSVVSKWVHEIKLSDSELNLGQTLKLLKKNYRLTFNVKGMGHQVGITAMTSTTVTIEVASTPQTATLSIGDIRKFDVNADGYYDISVKLDSISGNDAGLIIAPINEKINEETVAQEQEKQIIAEEVQSEEVQSEELQKTTKTNTLIWIIAIVVIILILVGISYWIKDNKKKKKRKF